MNPKLQALFTEYANDHQHPTNRLTHKVAIPMIVFHIVAMLDWLRLFDVGGVAVTGAFVMWAVSIGWYASMHPRLAAIMGLLYALCIPLGRTVTALPSGKAIVVAIAIVGWVVQLAGHVVWEKKSPSFLRNILQALVGPLFFVARLTGDWKPQQAASA